MSKRVTIHDIAREAGVSAATVSYVINNTEGQSISEETKNKIWHIINMFNYKPNVFAKNLRSSDRKLIAVCTENRDYAEKAEFLNLLDGLAASFSGNFDLIYSVAPFTRITNADAIVAYNVTKETFYEIGNQNYIPLIAVNCLVEDKLFFQVNPDYSKLKDVADGYFKDEYTFVCLTPADGALKNLIENTFEKVIFADKLNKLQNLKGNVLVIHGLIAEVLKNAEVNVLYENLYEPICKQTSDCILKALSRETFNIHSYKV